MTQTLPGGMTHINEQRIKKGKGQVMRFYGLALKATALMLALTALPCIDSPIFSRELGKIRDADDCDYYMSQYEKGNIDTIIIEHAKTCQTVMFGEIHDNVLEGMPSPVEDSFYVITLLPKLKMIGYQYLALEVDKNALEESHSYDILRFYEAYKEGKNVPEWKYSNAKPGWIKLVKKAMDLGYEIRFIDVAQKSRINGFLRDRAMFEEIKRGIFDENEKAKVIVYIGANHISHYKNPADLSSSNRRERTLGSLLDDYTKGKNFSVYMGHTYDTPTGCDLFISNFIWDTYRKKDSSRPTD